jgi:hypothetical protein
MTSDPVISKSVQYGDQEHYVNDPDSFYRDCYSSHNSDNEQCLSPGLSFFNRKTSPTFIATDYKHKSVIQDHNSRMEFFEQHFEKVFRDAREHELLNKDKHELVGQVQKLVSRTSELQTLVQRRKCVTDDVKGQNEKEFDITFLQKELESLREEKADLTKENERLKCVA